MYRETSALRLRESSTLVTEVGTKVAAIQTMTSSLNMDCEAIKAKLDLHGQNSADRHYAHQQELKSQLNDHHQQNQQKLSVIQLSQADCSSHQQRLFDTTSRTEKRLAVLHAKGQRASHSSAQNHQKTRVLFKDGFETLQVALNKTLVDTKMSDNQVYFRGERVDMIMSHLLPIKDELNTVISQVLSKSDHDVPIDEVLFLRDELKNLLGSAAQEVAARYARSTATSFDDWHFPGLVNDFRPGAMERQGNQAADNGEMINSRNPPSEVRPKGKRAKTRILSFQTESGTLRLRVPQENTKGTTSRNSCDFGLSFISHPQPPTIVDVRFTQFCHHRMRPRICAQLNVFTLVTFQQIKTCLDLFIVEADIESFDIAISKGYISPYNLHYSGQNALLRVSIASCTPNTVLLSY